MATNVCAAGAIDRTEASAACRYVPPVHYSRSRRDRARTRRAIERAGQSGRGWTI